MVLVISANTTIKLVGVGKREVVKQYSDYKKGRRGIDFSALKDLTKEVTEDVKRSLPAGKPEAAKAPVAKPPPPPPPAPKKK